MKSAPERGFEPLTVGLEGRCSIHLSYSGFVALEGRDPPDATTVASSLSTSFEGTQTSAPTAARQDAIRGSLEVAYDTG